MKAVFLSILLVGVSAFDADFTSEDAGKPVQKVVKLLKEMGSQLQKEQDNDQEIFDAMVCWCETNSKAKAKAVAEAQQHSKELTASIEEFTSKSAQLKVDVATLGKDIGAAEKALAESTAIREKEAADFHEEEKNAMVSIAGLKDATLVLGNTHSLSQTAMLQIQKVIKDHLGKDSARTLARLGLSPKQIRKTNSFLQQSAQGFQAYQPASGEIYGILNGMKESFETNLDDSKREEQTANGSYEQLKSAKSEELAASRTGLANKKEELADTDEKLSNAKVDLEDTTAQLEADSLFLADLKERCGNMDQQWASRQKVRNEEMTAVSEALSILTSDDARDQFSKSVSLMQTSSSSQRRQRSRDRAGKLLMDVARKVASPQLSALAVMLKSNVFTKIKKAIDDMTSQLAQESKDEVKHRDWCNEELHQNAMQTQEKYDVKSDLETKIADLKNAIGTLADGIEVAKAEVASTHVAMKRASENREAQNKDFQMTVSDQRATQAILAKAVERLNAFYAKGSSLVEESHQVVTSKSLKSTQAPPPGFGGSYQKSGGASGVVSMIEGIISESKTVEQDATEGEQASQTAYEEFIKDSNAEVKTLNEEIATKTEAKAKAEEDKVSAEADHRDTFDTLESLNTQAGELHTSCDFTLKNFDLRQESRSQEVDALNQAKAILSGADPDLD